MNPRRFTPVALLVALCAPAVHAQMVSAPDMGFLRTELTRDMLYAEAGYSITPVLAVGPAWYRIDGPGGPTLDAFTANVNRLVWRQNNPGSQANLYLGAGAGGLLVDKTSEEAVGAGLIQADWENRRWHVMYQGQALFNDRRFNLMNIVHAGWAPWIADYDAVAPWIYLRGGHTTGRDAEVNFGATLVLMYKNILVEAGADTHGNPIVGLRCLFSF
jgi:hypothetical protein